MRSQFLRLIQAGEKHAGNRPEAEKVRALLNSGTILSMIAEIKPQRIFLIPADNGSLSMGMLLDVGMGSDPQDIKAVETLLRTAASQAEIRTEKAASLKMG